MELRENCSHFRSDRPCRFHKEEGVRCEGCPYYDPVETTILVVKLDSAGDVLRTTSILGPLKERDPRSRITWITLPFSVPLLEGNPHIDAIVPYSTDALLTLATERFDLCLNVDASPRSSRLAALCRADEKLGFSTDEAGRVFPVNEEAHEWFLMGLDDERKRANRKTYQEIVCGIVRLPYSPETCPTTLSLSDEELRNGADFARDHGLREDRLTIGINSGAGGRWPMKRWTLAGFDAFTGLLLEELPGCRILLYGGSEEVDRNRALIEKRPEGLVDTGCGNTLREFASLVNLTDVFVTGDTLAMHVALALGKRVVALFGPTSSQEILLYGRGEKVLPPTMDCLGCYRNACDVRPTCMERITPRQVMDAVHSVLRAVDTDGPSETK